MNVGSRSSCRQKAYTSSGGRMTVVVDVSSMGLPFSFRMVRVTACVDADGGDDDEAGHGEGCAAQASGLRTLREDVDGCSTSPGRGPRHGQNDRLPVPGGR